MDPIVSVSGVPDGCFDILFEWCSNKVTIYFCTSHSLYGKNLKRI